MAHKPKTDPKTVALGRLIELLAITDPLGIKRLEGLSPAPDWVDLVEAIQEAPPAKLPVKTPRGNMTEAERRVFLLEKIEAVLSVCGGWPPVVEAVREFKRLYPDRWDIVKRYAWVKVAPARFETVQDMADRLHMDRSTIPRNCRRVATMVAYMAVAGCTP